MAESAVNISSVQHKKPNIFELVAQESFINNIQPALKSLCIFAAEKNFTVFGPVLKWYEELFLGFNLVLQYYYLKGFNSSFSEAFYGLRRIAKDTPKGKLPKKLFVTSLVCVAVIPYIKYKVNALARSIENNEIVVDSRKKKMVENFLKTHKTVGTAYGVLRLYYIVSYAAGFAKIHDPLLKVAGVELIYHDRSMPSWKDIWKALITQDKVSPKATLKLFLKLIASSLEIGAFFIQFLSWWHSDESRAGSLTSLPIPKAPHLNAGSTFCPICLRNRKNEVVLLTSGYVFCYMCIKDYLDRKGVCPVTNLPSSANNLVRIYPPET